MNMTTQQVRGGGIVTEGTLTRILSLLGGPVRMEIIRNLALGPRPVGQLAQETGQSIGLISHNLRLLREANLVACTPRSRQRIYSLAPNVTVNYAKGMMDLRVHAAAEGNLALSIPTPLATESNESPTASAKGGAGLSSEMDCSNPLPGLGGSGGIETTSRLAKGA